LGLAHEHGVVPLKSVPAAPPLWLARMHGVAPRALLGDLTGVVAAKYISICIWGRVKQTTGHTHTHDKNNPTHEHTSEALNSNPRR